MALGLGNTTPRPLGPGYTLLVTGIAGPTPLDQIVLVALSETSGAPGHPSYGRAFTHGETFAHVQLGVDETRPYEQNFGNFLADGGSIYVLVSSGSESIIYPGFTWDPLSHIGQLVATGISKGAAIAPSGGSGLAIGTLDLSIDTPILLVNPYVSHGHFDIAGRTPAPAGMQWQVTAAPSGAGLDFGWLPEYEDRVLQLVAYYRLADGEIVGEAIVSTRAAQGLVVFDKGTPDHVDYWVTDGFAVSMWWLVPP